MHLNQRLRDQRGFSAAQSLVGGGMLVVLALGLSQLISSSMRTQRQTSLRSTRDQLITYYTGLTRNPVAKTNTLAGTSAENKVLREHVNATAPQAAGKWDPATNIHPVDYYDAGNKLTVPATGLYLMENGQTCPGNSFAGDSCPTDKATWKVDIQWIAHPGTEIEIRSVINQVKKAEGDITLKEYTFKSLDSAAENYWLHGAGDIVYKNIGFVGIGTDSPLQPLQVNGSVRISAPLDATKYYMDISPVERVAGDIYYDFVIKDWAGIQDVAVLTLRGQDGYLGVGTANPVANLHVSGEGSSTDMKITNTTSDKTLLLLVNEDGDTYIQEQSTDDNAILLSHNKNVGIGLAAGTDPGAKLDVNGVVRATSFVPPSDARLKRDVRTLEDSLAQILRLRGVSYAWTAEAQREHNLPARREFGLIAQEVEKVYPQIVHTDAEGLKSVDYMRLVAPLIEALRTQQAELASEKTARLELGTGVRRLESVRGISR